MLKSIKKSSMKNWLLLIGTLLAFSAANAQLTEENVFGHYILNPVLINPGATGFQEAHLAQMNIRSAWAGFDGAPRTYALNYNGAFGEVLGLGASVRSENAASLTSLHVALNYAVRFNLTEDFKLAAGLSTEFTTNRVSDGVLGSNFLDETADPVILANVDGIRYFDMAAGVYGSFKENTFFGVSLPNVVQRQLNVIQATDTTATNSLSFIFQLGHRVNVKDQDFSIEPSLMVMKMDDIYRQPLQIEFNLLTRFMEERLAAGLSYRYIPAMANTLDSFTMPNTGGIVKVLLGTKVTAFKVFYSYDLSFQRFQSYSGGAHEITLAFDLSGENSSSRRKRQFKNR